MDNEYGKLSKVFSSSLLPFKISPSKLLPRMSPNDTSPNDDDPTPKAIEVSSILSFSSPNYLILES